MRLLSSFWGHYACRPETPSVIRATRQAGHIGHPAVYLVLSG